MGTSGCDRRACEVVLLDMTSWKLLVAVFVVASSLALARDVSLDPTRFEAVAGTRTLRVVTTVVPADVRTCLNELKTTFREDAERDGTVVFEVAGPRGPVSIALRKDGAADFVTSIEMTGRLTTSDRLLLSAANDWNGNNRFVRCSVDAEGRPVLASDVVVADGVTQESLKTSVRVFLLSAKKFEAEVLAKRGL